MIAVSQAQQEAPSVVYATGMLGGALIVVCIGIVLYLYGPGWLYGLRRVIRRQREAHQAWVEQQRRTQLRAVLDDAAWPPGPPRGARP